MVSIYKVRTETGRGSISLNISQAIFMSSQVFKKIGF